MNVRWIPAARKELAKIWLRADSAQPRDHLGRARDRHALGSHPDSEGESREEDLRVCFESPLGILFRVENRTTVYVARVWQFR